MPTIPTFRLVPTRPIRGFFSGASTFFGAIAHQLGRKTGTEMIIPHKNSTGKIKYANGPIFWV
jgi:hypothetical protein